MPLIDPRGRILGRVNLIDAAMGVGVIALVGAAYTGYALYRVPAVPRVDAVEPAELAEGRGLTVRLRGEGFLPFFRVFVERAEPLDALSFTLSRNEPSDEFTLSNRAQARWLVESPTLAEVQLPDGLRPGTYDLGFYDETRRIAVKARAVTVRPPAVPLPPTTAELRVIGAFRGLDERAASLVAPGVRLPEGGAPWAEVVAVDPPRPDTMRLQVGNGFVDALVPGRVQVPAVLRITCLQVNTRCRAGEADINTFIDLQIAFAGGTVPFSVEQVEPELPGDRSTATVRVRFTAHPEVAALIRPGDVDRSRIGLHGVRQLASTIASVGRREAVTGFPAREPGEGAPAFQVQERLLAVEAVLTVPVVVTPDGLLYRGQPLRAGGSLRFATDTYVVTGTVLQVAAGSARRPEP